MKDFTLEAYQNYIQAIKQSIGVFYRFDQFLELSTDNYPSQFCLLRHDVDRKPHNALRMAEVEHQLEVQSTYYFRTKFHTFKPEIIKKIADLGHEIGYHYETLSDTKGDLASAYELFENELNRLRKIVSVRTCSMHGRPLSSYDNRLLWKESNYHGKLKEDLDIFGEVYLDIDYTRIAYITDTGRNWKSTQHNLRDMVNSKVSVDFESGSQLFNYLKDDPHPKMVFQIHPERWSHSQWDDIYNITFDYLVNGAKQALGWVR